MSTHARFQQLTPQQQGQARARFLDAGTSRDDYWYELTVDGDVLCRTRKTPMQDRVTLIADRLDVIADAVARGDRSELTMRVPAEPDRDADLVASEAARLLCSIHSALTAEPTNTEGPAGTYGCACVSDDARMCYEIRYDLCPLDDPEERCECLCHEWRDEDEDGETP